jgi:hypothetical protein
MAPDLHLISFDNPVPPDYGGVVDVFYKTQALEQIGVRVALHLFTYGRRTINHEALAALASRVHVYPRRTSLLAHLHHRPFIVRSRQHPDLLHNLLADHKPILFEGIHTTAYLHHPDMQKRITAIRVHNIEQQYYACLAQTGGIKSAYYRLEALKLAHYEQSTWDKANWLLPVSQTDMEVLPALKTRWLPVFNLNEKPHNLPEPQNFVLFHGNLAVSDNSWAAAAIIKQFAPATDTPLVIAGKNPPQQLIDLAQNTPHIRIVANPTAHELEHMLHSCGAHLLWTSMQAGVKLKLIHALRTGRPVICNAAMVVGSGLENGVYLVQTIAEALLCIRKNTWNAATNTSLEHYNNTQNARLLANLMGLN